MLKMKQNMNTTKDSINGILLKKMGNLLFGTEI